MIWYFDFISPYAYLQSTRLQDFSEKEPVECRPVLFAGLLNHWSNVGPAEIRPKRQWTFEHIIWLAQRDGIEFNLPAHHPFNPIPLLRLAIVLDNQIEVVQRIFRFVWVEGCLPQQEEAFSSLLSELGVAPNNLQSDSVKQKLYKNGDDAIAQSVFGVPTIVRDERFFWGYDATDMAIAHRDRRTHSENWPEEKLAGVSSFPEGQGRSR